MRTGGQGSAARHASCAPGVPPSLEQVGTGDGATHLLTVRAHGGLLHAISGLCSVTLEPGRPDCAMLPLFCYCSATHERKGWLLGHEQ